jgi:hypothetical protein
MTQLKNFAVQVFNNFSLMMQLRELGEKAGYIAVCQRWREHETRMYLTFKYNKIGRGTGPYADLVSLEDAIAYLQSVIDQDNYKHGDWLICEDKADMTIDIFQFDKVNDEEEVFSLQSCFVDLADHYGEVNINIDYRPCSTYTYAEQLKNYRKATTQEIGFYSSLINKFKAQAKTNQFKETYLTAAE